MLLDIGIGIFASILVGKLFSLPLTPLLVGFGVACALIPDIDLWYTIARRGHRDIHAIIKHRNILHYPLVYIPVGTALTALFGYQWSLLFFLASFGHFIHDSIGLGWGVAWLWPFTTRSYTFFYRYTAPEKRLPRQALYRWERQDMDRLIDTYRDANWLRNIYLKLHPVFAIEIAGFLFAVYLLWRIGAAYAGN
ncbi:MAG: metal-dependent hydrolase [Candidatus Sungbacteria bacterium]|uniref:Metal-dependent hydrolase n=1 Tax=Candidatus Sungiibacteriota bacterium TaxID=2750080 RepID=A0A932YXQ3_9BACT|nr:metal-dependent hydrolase [Candidatus Sungbacteria bacterium]